MPLAKITPPRLAGVMPRRRLCDLIDRADTRILWVCAPAGAGKTTLAVEYVTARNVPCLWYQMDSGDTEPATFFHYLRLALKRVRPRPGHLPPLLSPEYVGDLELFTRRYFEKLFSLLCKNPKATPRPGLMVLDDFQNLNDSATHELLRIGLSVVPDTMNLLVLSREPPPACFARLRAVNAMRVLEGGNLLFSAAETEAFFDMQPQPGRLPAESVRLVHDKTQGWAAGVRLLGAALARTPQPLDTENLPRETIFDFFQQELFAQLKPQTRDFLLKTALLPSMTARLAQALTGLASSSDLLCRMSANNFFVVRHQGQELTYSYHQLFREFLLIQGRTAFAPEHLALLRRNAAAILKDTGRPEDAAELYILGDEAELLAGLCQDLAPTLLGQGRQKTLARWLDQVPERIRQRRPWLGYWSARAIPPWKVQEQRLLLEQAIDGFTARGDQMGVCLARAEMLMTTLVDMGIHPAIQMHFRRLCADVGPNFSFPNIETEARIVLAMILAATFSHPGHPHVRHWVQRGFKLLQASVPVDQKINLGLNLLILFIYLGDFHQAERLYLRLQTVVDHKAIPDLARLQWRLLEAMYTHLMDPRRGRCQQAVDHGLDLAEASGIHLYDVFLLVIACYMALNRGDQDRLARLIQRLEPLLSTTVPLGTVNYHCMRCHEHLVSGNGATALQQGLLALEALPQPRSPLPAAFILIGMAEACIEADNWAGARTYLKQARQITSGIPEFRGDVLFLIPVAYAAFRRGSENVGLRVLKTALLRARAGRWLNALYWRPRQLALLCAKALAAGLETDYVQTLVQHHDLKPRLAASPYGVLRHALEIRTLGGLSILRDGYQLPVSGIGTGKPLTLLKALLVLGPENVPEAAICNLLWPEAEGDKATQSFKFTLHSLRKFLDVPEAITVKRRSISLNPHVCLLDLTQFGQACVHVAKAGDDRKSIADEIVLCEAALHIYQGDFLPQDPTDWLTPTRDKLKDRYREIRARLYQIKNESGNQGQGGPGLICS